MKQTINESQFRDAFKSIRPDNFSYAGLGELFDWIEQIDEECGTETELDVIALCCDFSEYTLPELKTEYGYLFNDMPATIEEWADKLSEHTTVIPVRYRNSIAPDMDTESLIIQSF
jgi:hypothetical protein